MKLVNCFNGLFWEINGDGRRSCIWIGIARKMLFAQSDGEGLEFFNNNKQSHDCGTVGTFVFTVRPVL